MSILVITTGGTIGALPYHDIRRQPIYKTMPSDGTDIVKDILQKDFTQYDMRFVTMPHLDSNFIDDEYRAKIVKIIEQSPEDKVLITHGTDTILLTADFLFRQQRVVERLGNKTLLLTGSMVALSCGAESDGFLNISFALSSLSKASAGVYIVLCDYDNIKTRSGWAPHLYIFEPGKFAKTHDLDHMDRDRLYLASEQAS